MMLCLLGVRRRALQFAAFVLISLPGVGLAYDFDQVVLGAPILEFEGGDFSGALHGQISFSTPDLRAAFPAGIRFGVDSTEVMGILTTGAVFLDEDEYADGELDRIARGTIADLATRGGQEDEFLASGGAFWAPLAHGTSGYASARTMTSWRLLPREDAEPGQLVITWENIATASGEDYENTFQMIWREAQGAGSMPGDSDVEIRYSRCAHHMSVVPRPPYFVVTGFKNAVFVDDVYMETQPPWRYAGSYANQFKKLCLLSNDRERGVWRYAVRDGVVTGCGLGPAWVNNAGAVAGEVCHDDNNESGDGCSASCLVEADDDGDGLFEAPPGGMLNDDGTPYDPLEVYDPCVPNDACDDDDDDGIPAEVDNCPVFNPLQLDFDGDGDGDACDEDNDNDGFVDAIDLCPLGYSRVLHNAAPLLETPWIFQPDQDRDGMGDRCDPDDDGDGVLDCGDDGICRYFDDGIGNDPNGLRFVDFTEDGGEQPSSLHDNYDNDEDGLVDENRPFANSSEAPYAAPAWQPGEESEDNCRVIPNPDQANADGDLYGDACDADADDDTVLNCGAGACPYTQDLRDNDHDGAIDEATECAEGCDALSDLVDNDGDGYVDEHLRGVADGPRTQESSEIDVNIAPWQGGVLAEDADNCPLAPNINQPDDDGDGVGDACDDDDGDGIPVRKPDHRDERQQLVLDEPFDNCRDTPNPDQADQDGNGLGDACDPDRDADGVPNVDDNCPAVDNASQDDLDQDGEGDLCDLDWDGDDVSNEVDNCELIVNPMQLNLDDDALGDACDPDMDGDAALNDADNCPRVANDDQADFDGDDLGDACDDDDDDDGAPDAMDNCPRTAGGDADQTDTDDDGMGNVCDGDDDNDEVEDGLDLCPLLPNEGALGDNDNDGMGDPCDDDDDNDGIPDVDDNCPFVPSEGNLYDLDEDGVGDACDVDDDDDGLLDDDDNCPRVPNADQANFDGDGMGDACDNDRDGDNRADGIDNCRDTPNPDQLDADDDGDGDACDANDDNDAVPDVDDNCQFAPNDEQIDTDQDGEGDACDGNDDNDEVVDGADNCPLVGNSDQADMDGDGQGDACDTDDDGDGFDEPPVGTDNCIGKVNVDQADFNTDGLGDACSDADDDGVLDADDNCPIDINPNQNDVDTDGIGDACDPFNGNPDDVDTCRKNTPPILWAKKCGGTTQKIGCVAAPGGSSDGDLGGWWLLSLLALRRRR